MDIIGSFIFGSLLTLNVIRMNGEMAAQSYKSSLDYVAQTSASTIAEIIDNDFQKIGYGVADTALTLADSTQIRFLADLGADGSVDTLFYYLSGTDDADHTPNPYDRVLYRVLNSGTPQGMQMGETRFDLTYFNSNGDSLASPVTLGDVRGIRVDLKVQSEYGYDNTYQTAFMQLRVWPRNIEP